MGRVLLGNWDMGVDMGVLERRFFVNEYNCGFCLMVCDLDLGLLKTLWKSGKSGVLLWERRVGILGQICGVFRVIFEVFLGGILG
jgi:hypothetical protein